MIMVVQYLGPLASPSKRKLSGISGGGLLRNIQLALMVLF
jgi:hypothetical protein